MTANDDDETVWMYVRFPPDASREWEDDREERAYLASMSISRSSPAQVSSAIGGPHTATATVPSPASAQRICIPP